MSSLGKSVVHGANTLLELVDLKLTRHREQDWSDPSTYIPFKETLAAAERAGMSVGEYIDNTYNVAGSTELTIKELVGLGVLHGHVDRVCEVGPGSGRYLEKVTALTTPDHYEVYETATPWANWLAATQRVTVRPTDGKTLASTADASVDLTHAHKVMVVVPFLTICRYLLEMMRVTRECGYVVFDLMTDECLPEDTLRSWIDSDIQSISYPSFITRKVVVDLFTRGGFDLVGTFFIPMQPGITQYFAFRRRPAATA